MTASSAVQGESSVQARPLPDLREYAENVHSQFGEDGILAEIVRRTGLGHGRALACVELGAWDGIHLSNTRRLIESFGARAVLIEADRKRYAELVANCAAFGSVETVHRRVAIEGPDSLDEILAETSCPERFDVLSLDIDGHDYWVWHGLERYRPSVVIVEHIPTIPTHIAYVQPRYTDKRHGSSLRAMAELGASKGYTLVAATEVNAILVENDLVPALGLEDLSIDTLVEGLPDLRTYLFQTHDGHIGIVGHRQMNWHGTSIHLDRLQALPWWLRRHPDDMGPVRRLLLSWYRRRARKRLRRWYGADERERREGVTS